MGKTGKWIRNFLTGKKDKDNNKHSSSSTNHHHPTNTPVSIPPPSTPKEKRRWSFRRPAAPQTPDHASAPPPSLFESEKHAMAVAVATAAAADAAVAAASAAAAMMRLTVSATGRGSPVQVAAAIKIQSAFRSYLARKALNALKGLVKLQALVRGHLVRKQATATLRCMQALVTVQARARAQRLRLSEHQITPRRNSHSHDNRFRHDVNQMEENIKIVEMDIGQSRSNTNNYRKSSYSNKSQKVSPAPSALTELSPRASSGHFEDFSFGTTQSSPQHYYSAISKPESVPRHDYAESLCYEYSFYPNYMANTESSRAKVRSHSAPKQRPPDSYERQSSVKRRPSIEGRNVPRAVRMQRSSSHVGSTAQNYQYPWSVKLDKSTVSLINSECGSTSTVLTNSHYCKSIAGFDTEGNRY